MRSKIVITHVQLSAWGVKCPPFLLLFFIHIHTFTHMTVTLRGVGGRGLFQKILSKGRTARDRLCWHTAFDGKIAVIGYNNRYHHNLYAFSLARRGPFIILIMAWVKVRFYHNATQTRPATLCCQYIKIKSNWYANRACAVSIECLLFRKPDCNPDTLSRLFFEKVQLQP